MPSTARKTQAEKVNQWISRVQMGERKLDHRRSKMVEYLNNYRNRYWKDEGDLDAHRVSVNVVAGLMSLLVPTIYFKDPRVKCNPRRPGDEKNCRVTEALANYWIKELSLKHEVKSCILDAGLFGVGYMKLGYEVELEQLLDPVTNENGIPLETEMGEPLMQDELGNVYKEIDGKFIQVMDADGDMVPEGQEQPTLNEFIRREQPYAVRWSPFDVIKDPEAKRADLRDSRWVAFRLVLPIDEVKSNPLYKNTANLKGSRMVERGLWERLTHTADPGEKDEELDRVELWEIWAKVWNDSRKRYDMWQYVIAKGHDKFLLERKSPYIAEGFPCAVLYFMEDPEDGYPMPILSTIDSQIESINLSRAAQVNHRERFNRRYVFNKALLTEDDARRIAQAQDGEVVGVTVPPDTDLKRVMVPVEDAQVNPELYRDYDYAYLEIQRTLGVTDYDQATAGPARRATEANLIQQSSMVRMMERQDQVGDFVLRVVTYWIQLLKQYGDYDMALKVTNEVGQEEWAAFKVAYAIPDDALWDVDVSPSAFESKEIEQKKAMDMYNLLRKDPMVQGPKLIERVLRAFGETEPLMFMNPPMIDPMTGMPIDPLHAQGAPGSVTEGGGAMDTNQLREPAATDVGSTGRAAA